MDNVSGKWLVFLLLALGFLTRFAWISRPAVVIFDEQYFAVYAEDYFHGTFFFDVQPPLGHLLLFSALKIAHANPGQATFDMGDPYPPGYPYVAARFLPALAGSLLPAILYLLGRALTLRPATCFFAGLLVVLDNALLVESHYALIDIFVPVFGFSALLIFLLHRKQKSYSALWWLAIAGAATLGGLSLSVKWTGLGSLGVMGAISIFDFTQRRDFPILAARAATLLALPAAIYVAVFAVHFRLLPRAGQGDAYVSANFNATLVGSPESHQPGVSKPLGFWGKFAELNKDMYAYDSQMTFFRSFRSRFYEWPIGEKPIPMFADSDDPKTTVISVLMRANPAVWYFGMDTIAAALGFVVWRRRAIRKLCAQSEDWRQKMFALGFLFLVYFANWLPFAAIKRNLFLYHYFSALLASILAGSLLLFELVPAVGFSGKSSGKIAISPLLYWGLLAMALAGFIALSPTTYGFHVYLP